MRQATRKEKLEKKIPKVIRMATQRSHENKNQISHHFSPKLNPSGSTILTEESDRKGEINKKKRYMESLKRKYKLL